MRNLRTQQDNMFKKEEDIRNEERSRAVRIIEAHNFGMHMEAGAYSKFLDEITHNNPCLHKE